MDLEEWGDITILNNLVKHRGIERENFDFKSKDIVFGRKVEKERLESQLCAMANTNTGILCLGVDNVKSTSPTAEFKPNGFRIGTEEEIKKSILVILKIFALEV
jgi:predicted HTH transcriptional regulator